MFTNFDVLVCVILAISTLIGLLRGFIKEVLSIVGWFGAAALTFYMYPLVAEKLSTVFKSEILINAIAIVAVFVGVLVLISVFNMMVLDNLRSIRAGGFDRSLGMMFGLLRGLLIVSVMHFGVIVFHKSEEGPKWIQKGETYGLTRIGGEWMKEQAKDYLENPEETIDETLGKTREDVEEAVDEKLEGTQEALPVFPALPDGDSAEENSDAEGDGFMDRLNDFFSGEEKNVKSNKEKTLDIQKSEE